MRQQVADKQKANPKNASLMPAIFNYSFDPLSKRMSDHIYEYINARDQSFNRFCDRFYQNKNRSETVYLIRAYCERHHGLSHLLYFCYMWARLNDLLIEEPTRTEDDLIKLENEGCMPAYTRQTICLTFLQFGLDGFNGVRTNYKPFLEEVRHFVVILLSNSEF